MSTDEMRFDGRVAIVTGGGRGQGRAHALQLASRGARVVVNDLDTPDESPAAQVAAEIGAAGGEAIARTDDISQEASARALVDAALEAFGRVDILINNAGVIRPRTSRTHAEGVRQQHEGERVRPYYTSYAVWPHFLAQGYGRLIMVTSGAGLWGYPDRVDYSASKAAMIGMTRALASEAHERGIMVNGVIPSAITRISSEPQIKMYIERFGLSHEELLEVTPYLVSAMVVYLAHEQCPVNGEIYEAGEGDYRRVLIGASEGYVNTQAKAEDVRDQFGQIMDSGPFEPREAYRTRGVWPTDDLIQPALQ